MIFRVFLFLATFFLVSIFKIEVKTYVQVQPAEGQQQMSDFSLSGFGEKGKKSWDLTGKQADIASEIIKLNNIESNFYGDRENMKLTADRGNFDRVKGSMHLEKDVVITTSSGARLTTNSLDWDRKEQLVTTPDPVNIVKDDMTIDGQGVRANTGLNIVNLEKDVKVQIDNVAVSGSPKKGKIEITCDGPLEVDYQKNLATFHDKVKVHTQDGLIESDAMDVYFSGDKAPADQPKQAQSEELNGSKIDKIIARGSVKITRGQNVSFSDEAVYSARERKITLTGRPKLVIFSEEKFNAPLGN
ncbi:MAG: LPS export ABC transporter periplasmic protein LptC [Candidatus Omnitrophica bacterium]|nr:LPS export ABC transporter periplasmic protein LptC [Candidatus Omnitrophota bacterium]